MEESVRICMNFLKSKWVKVQQEWCEACLEWIMEEHNGLPKVNELTNLVYEQWLMADLREIAEPSLPSIADKKGSSTFNGTFCVQVNYIRDIGHSSYSQLIKIKGCEIDDIDEEEDDLKQFFKDAGEKKASKVTPKWKESFARMMFMEVHDGHQAVEAIEYQPIKELSVENILPGCKLLLSGPIMSRDGLLFLKPHNVKIMGGNAEQLLKSGSQLAVLQNILNIGDDEKNKMEIQLNFQKQQQLNCNQYSKSVKNIPISSSMSRDTNRDSHVLHSIRNQKDGQKENLPNQSNSRVVNGGGGDDFNDDLFINDIFEDIDIDIMALDRATGNKSKDNETDKGNSNIVNKFESNSKSVKNINNKENKLNEADSNVIDSDLLESDLFTDDIDLLDIADGHSSDLKTEKKDLVGESPSLALTRRKSYSDRSRNISSHSTDSMISKVKFPPNEKVRRREVIKEKGNVNTSNNRATSEPNIDEFANGDEDPSNHFTKAITLPEMIAANEPLQGIFSIQGWFTTLTSTLDYDPHYRLTAIITDGDQFVEIMLGDEVLNLLVGYSAKQVHSAISGQLSSEKKEIISASLKEAEKSLELKKWIMEIKFDRNENIYSIINMKSLGLLNR